MFDQHFRKADAVVPQTVLESATRRSGSSRRYVTLTVLGIALLQLLWIVAVPPFRASDEFDHAYRASAVAHGQWRADQAVTPDRGRGVYVRPSADIVIAAHKQCASLGYTGVDNCTAARTFEDGTVLVGSGAGTYNPAFYWVIGTASLPFEGASALLVMRLVSAILCLLFLGLGAWALATRGRPGWGGVAFIIALSPVFVFSTGVAAPNGLEMATALAFWAALLVLPDVKDLRVRRRLLVLATVAAALLTTLRMLGPLFVVVIILLVLVVHGSRSLAFVRSTGRWGMGCAIIVLAATTGAGAWTVASNFSRTPGAGREGDSLVPTSLILWPLQTIAAFPFRDVPGPAAVYVVVGGAAAVLTVAALRAGGRRDRRALVAGILAGQAVPLILTLATMDSAGVIWQGRYGLPLTIGFLFIAGKVLQDARERGAFPAPSAWLVLPGLAVAAVAAASVVKVIQLEAQRAASATDVAWHPPAGWVVYVVTIAAYGCLGAAIDLKHRASRTR